MRQERNINRDWALRLAEAGIATFPCGPDKKPLIKWREFSSSDPEAVADVVVQHPNALPGIDLGKCDLIVLDGDRHGGPDGRAALRALPKAQPDYDAPATPRAFTPGDGAHVYFRQNGHELTNSRGNLPEYRRQRRRGLRAARRPPLPRRAEHAGPDLGLSERDHPADPEGIVSLLEGARPRTGQASESETDAAKPGIRERCYALTALDGCVKELAACQPGARGWLYRAHVEADLAAKYDITIDAVLARSSFDAGNEDDTRADEPETESTAAPDIRVEASTRCTACSANVRPMQATAMSPKRAPARSRRHCGDRSQRRSALAIGHLRTGQRKNRNSAIAVRRWGAREQHHRQRGRSPVRYAAAATQQRCHRRLAAQARR